MRYFFFILGVLSFFLSCDQESQRTLYNQNDPEWIVWANYEAQTCIADSQFFKVFDIHADFTKALFKEGKIYKIIEDDKKTFITVGAVTATDVILTFSSTNDDYNKIITFTSANHVSIGNFLKPAVCSTFYDEFFTGISGKDSSTTLGFTWFKETITVADSDEDSDDTPEEYYKRKDTHSVNLNYPSLLFHLNGTKDYTYKFDETDAKEENEVTKFVITDVTDADECEIGHASYNTACTTAGVTRNCTITVDEDAYKLRPHNTPVLTISGDAGCKFMPAEGDL